jgi:hypothetical protein
MASFARSALGPLLAATIIGVPLLAGQQSPVTAADYARAERFLAPAVTPLVAGGCVSAERERRRSTWIAAMEGTDLDAGCEHSGRTAEDTAHDEANVLADDKLGVDRRFHTEAAPTMNA